MRHWAGKSKGTPLGYAIFIWIIRNWGIRAAYILLYFVVLYYIIFSVKTTRTMYRFYRYRVGVSRWKSFTLVYKNYFSLGQSLIDKVAMLYGFVDRFRFEFEGEEYLHQMVREGKGGIILSAHLGSWESAGHLLKRLGTPINVLMYEGEAAALRRKMSDIHGARSFRVITIGNDLNHIFAIMEALGRNEIVCMHADRFLPGNKTVAVEFMGEPAYFPEGPFVLSMKLNVPVAWVFAFRESGFHYHFYSTPLMRFNQREGDNVVHLAGNFAREMEKMIRKYPEQWFNYYDFWLKT